MYSGQGGGLCDCGDPEAFVQFATCNNHKSDGADEKQSIENQLALLPEDMKTRTKMLFTQLCKYVIQMTANRPKQGAIAIGDVYKEKWKDLRHPTEVCTLLQQFIN